MSLVTMALPATCGAGTEEELRGQNMIRATWYGSWSDNPLALGVSVALASIVNPQFAPQGAVDS